MALLLAYSAVLASLLSGGVSLAASGRSSVLRFGAFPLLGAAGVLAALAGIHALLGGEVLVDSLPFGLPWLAWQVRLDALSGLFLLIIGLVTAAVSLFGPGYVREYEHGRNSLVALGGFTGLFVAGMLLVVLAADAFLFMIAWELMSLSSYFLVAFQHENPANRRAAFLYLLMAHVGALGILLAYGVLAAFGGGNFDFASMRAGEAPLLWSSVAFGLAFFGFGMKAGLVPLHAWLPEAHPVAPSHISALMSGVMLKVAVYGFIRVVFDLIGSPHWGWGVAVLMVGSASGLLGALYAMMQSDIKRLLAYSSIENVGIIFVGLGLALVFLGSGHPTLGYLGLIAALYHAFNHALFKSLLFMGVGAVLQRSHEQELERMGGLLRRMPWTGAFILIGCVSIASLPPFNGFVSEWLTFQAALNGIMLENGLLRILIPVTAAMLALTAAVAAATFVKMYGVGFLGRARSRRVRHSREVSWEMLAAQGFLALLCLLFGLFPTAFVEALNAVPRLLYSAQLPHATAHGWLWLTPSGARSASYAAPLVFIGIAGAWGISLLLGRLSGRRVRRVAAWDCGFGPLSPRMQYTATAFAMPIRRVFAPLFVVQEQVETATEKGGGVTGLRHQLQIGDRSWRLLYAPVDSLVIGLARRVTRLQTGNIRTYLAYSFFTLLVLLWLIS